MKKHIWLTPAKAEQFRLSPYADIIVKEQKLILIRADVHQMTSIYCSDQAVLDELYGMLVDGYAADHRSLLLEDGTIRAWLDDCVKKGVIE